MHPTRDSAQQRQRWPIWLAMWCVSLALLLSCVFGMLALGLQQRRIALPAFGVRLGPIWIESCFPRWEMPSRKGCIGDTGLIHRPNALWLVVDSTPLGKAHMHRLISIPPERVP